tara:strand:- start:9689 stop:10561 length:873 start_codon:yes stop_codon:yes gene_type:complete
MTEEAQAPLPSGPEAVEPSAPESFNIFSEEQPETLVQPEAEQRPAEPESRKGEAFLAKMREDKARRQAEIQLKQREASLASRMAEIEAKAKHLDSIGTNPTEFLRSQGIDPLDFQRKLANHAIHNGPSKEEQIEQTQLELAKLKASLEEKEKQAQRSHQAEKNQAAVRQFVSSIGAYGEANSEKYSLVKEQMNPGEIAEGMAAYYRQTGNQMSIEEAYEKLEAGLKKHEEGFYNNPRNREKFQRYSGAQRNVNGPQATMSSGWNEQPTRKGSEGMTYEQIRELWKNKIFT